MTSFCKILTVLIVVFFATAPAHGEEYAPYDDVLNSLINPHQQINDEGEILWGKCIICHPVTPDIYKDRSIKKVKLRYEEDLRTLCFRCHPQKRHPGGDWVGFGFGREGGGSPEHLVVPPPHIALNIKMSLKENKSILPRDPADGKIFCATCHNPHERGLLIGRADVGGDSFSRIRSRGETICQYCHRK